MSDPQHKTIDVLIEAFTNKDLEAALALFADDALVYDPHYPVPTMRGKDAIRQGFAWGLGNMEQPGFTVRHLWSDGTSGALEVDTHHVFKGGMALTFDQVFIFETRDGLIIRLQSYVPYPPGGIGGLLARVTRWIWKLKGKA